MPRNMPSHDSEAYRIIEFWKDYNGNVIETVYGPYARLSTARGVMTAKNRWFRSNGANFKVQRSTLAWEDVED